MKENWDRLQRLVIEHIQGEEGQKHLDLMDSIKDDRFPNGKHLLGFYRAPAAKGNHHNHEGGLVRHLLEMWDCWLMMKGANPQIVVPGHVDDERILKAILYHDLHKAFLTFELKKEDPWGTDYAKDVTDQLMTTDIKSIWILMDHGITLDPEQLNALCWAEGGFAKIRPNWTSVLAKTAYLLDEMSGNVIERVRKNTLYDHREPMK
jgi:hypothetical protein